MNRAGLLFRGLRTYWRTNAATAAGMAVATASLVGALLVGDSVRYSLRRGAEARVGQVAQVLSAGDRFFRAELAQAVSGESRAAPALLLSGLASTSDGSARVQGVNVHGVDGRFFALGPSTENAPAPPAEGAAFLNRELAQRLGVEEGESIVVRVAEPSALPRDVALAPTDTTLALRVRVERILEREAFGDFGLVGGSSTHPNLFVALEWLQLRLGLEGRANLLLTAESDPEVCASSLRAAWTIADAQLSLRSIEGGRRELRSDRIFFDGPVVELLSRQEGIELAGIFTYFVNSIESGERSTPYSMVSGLGSLKGAGERGTEQVLGVELGAEQILLNAWEAEDLGAAVGDRVTLRYHAIDAARRLVEAEHEFTVAGIVPLRGAAADRTLMPDFPGLSDAEHCRDWEPGTPVELERIRDKDEAYWDTFGGTPKAFLTLGAARSLWSSRYGELTAVRFAAEDEGELLEALERGLDPAQLGLFFRDFGASALAAAGSPTDFGGLFIGLSFFLILAALLLAGQLFAFGVQQRAREAGLLAALGFEGRLIRRLFLGEAALLSIGGGVVGVALGMVYTRLILVGLARVWRDAVARTPIQFHWEAATLAIGGVGAVAVSLGTTALVIRRELRAPSQALLARSLSFERRVAAPGRRRALFVFALACLAGALCLVVWVDPAAGPSAAGAFFGAGALVLTGLLSIVRLWLFGAAFGARAPLRSLGGLGRANAWRRPGRSLAVIALMAIGTFLVAAVGANRLGPVADEGLRASGTGGFALYGQTSLPLVNDLNTRSGREAFALPEEPFADVRVVPLRMRAGDDASCLNLSRPTTPRLIAVKSGALGSRSAFRFASTLGATDDPWALLEEELGDGTIPAIGDATSLTWQLKKSLGDTVDYVDERGQPFRVRIVATLADSILQGDLIVSEERFRDLYPTAGGYRLLLIDTPPEHRDEVARLLSRGLEDLGLSLERTGRRLATFHAVQNTYLSVFQVLGGLGLLLGSVGLGIVLLRNTFERRAELALLSALGFRARRVRWWVISEFGLLLVMGLGVGLLAALVAILPAMRAPASDLSLAQPLQLALAIALAGSLWILLAAQVAVRRTPLRDLT